MNITPISGLTPFIEPQGIQKQENTQTGGLPFADVLKESIAQLEETQKVSQQDAYDLAMGRTDDLAAISINSAKAAVALEMTVQVASRAVTAYKEILQMQI